MATRRRNPLAPGGGGGNPSGRTPTPRPRPTGPRTSNFGAWTGGDPRMAPGTPGAHVGTPGYQPAPPPATPPVEQRTPTPQYTPGPMDPQGTRELADLGQITTNRLAGYNRDYAAAAARAAAGRTASEYQLGQDRRAALNNAAARGATMSGIRAENETRAANANLSRLGDIENSLTEAGNTYWTNVNNTVGEYNRDSTRIATDAGERDYANWKQNTGDQVTAPAPTTTAAPANKPTWAQFRKSHPNARSAGEIAVLRQKYRTRFGDFT